MDDQKKSARISLVEEHIRLENLHDIDGIMSTYGETALLEDEACGDRHEGHEGVRAFYEELLGAIPDFHIEVKEQHVTDRAIIQEALIGGTHRGTWKGIPATGRRVEVPVLTIFTFDDRDTLAGERTYFDRVTVLTQMGVLPGGGVDGGEERALTEAGSAA